MKIDICDICYYTKKGMVECTHRIGFKGGVRIDACEKHSDWGRAKTKETFARDYSELQALFYGFHTGEAEAPSHNGVVHLT